MPEASEESQVQLLKHKIDWLAFAILPLELSAEIKMRISLNWLRELVEFDLDPEALAEALTMAGFEVEEIEDRRTWAEGVVVGKILSCEPHPNADKLQVCQVDIGQNDPLNIVCGAPNAQAGLWVPVATVGTYLPQIDLKIRASKLRGIASEGMICSLAELGLAKESAGIHSFEPSPPLGSDVRPLLGLDDVILDLTSTANRADALSMVGIAREVAALTGAPLKLPSVPEVQISTGEDLAVKISEPQACPVYIATAIEQVRIGPSPPWLQRRLQAAGTRPINNVVDVTNYILLAWGQPLHAFDCDALQATGNPAGLTLGVRFAQTGEALTTLDAQQRTLQPQALVITANDYPVALAGVMGGETTEVHRGSQRLILEAAVFNPTSIRRSARAQGLRTEASARYERGVNQAELEIACHHALGMIRDLAGGVTVAQQVRDYRSPAQRSIELRLDRVNQILGPIESADEGDELQAGEVERILKVLGFAIAPTTHERVWRVTVPPQRHRDIEREIDLIEEIARLYGYNHFSETLPPKTEPGRLSVDQSLIRQLREAFRATGLTELMHYSLVKPTSEKQVVIINPLFTEYSALRTDLLSALIDAFQYNLEQGNGALNGFEIGRVFWQEEDGHREADAIAGILGGDPAQGKWLRGSRRDQPITWFEAKGMLESVFERLALPVEYQPDRRDPRLHPGRTASLWLQGTRLGRFGQLHPQLRQERGLPDQVYGFELDLDVVLNYLAQAEETQALFQPYSPYPAVDRDIAFFAPLEISVAEIERVIWQAAGKLLESVELFDQYQGENVPAGQRSLAFRLIYRQGDRTLTDGVVDPAHQKVRQVLAEKLGVNLRS